MIKKKFVNLSHVHVVDFSKVGTGSYGWFSFSILSSLIHRCISLECTWKCRKLWRNSYEQAIISRVDLGLNRWSDFKATQRGLSHTSRLIDSISKFHVNLEFDRAIMRNHAVERAKCRRRMMMRNFKFMLKGITSWTKKCYVRYTFFSSLHFFHINRELNSNFKLGNMSQVS